MEASLVEVSLSNVGPAEVWFTEECKEERHPKRTYSFLWELLREKQFPNHACSSRVPVIDKLCEGLTQLESEPNRLRSMIYFPH